VERLFLDSCADAVGNRRLRAEIVEETMQLLGLEQHRNRLVRQLSGGQHFRAVIGRLLVRRPRLLVLDEPFKPFDSYTLENFRRLLLEFRTHYQLSILLSDRSMNAYSVCDKLYHLNGGVIALLPEADRDRLLRASENLSDSFFVSYSRKDVKIATQAVLVLNGEGVSTWFDQHDIPQGAHWDMTIQQALQACRGVIILLSPTSVASPNVLDEISYALDHQKLVLPLLIEDCKLPLRLNRVQYRDVRQEFQKKMRGVAELLKTDLR